MSVPRGVAWRVPNEVLAVKPSSAKKRPKKAVATEEGTQTTLETATEETTRQTKDAAVQKNTLTTGGSGRSTPTSQQRDGAQHRNNVLYRNQMATVNNSVDELYELCERTESIERCKDAYELMERCSRDFLGLQERIMEQRRFEMEDKRSVSWEVRMSTPKDNSGSKKQARGARAQMESPQHVPISYMPYVPSSFTLPLPLNAEAAPFEPTALRNALARDVFKEKAQADRKAKQEKVKAQQGEEGAPEVGTVKVIRTRDRSFSGSQGSVGSDPGQSRDRENKENSNGKNKPCRREKATGISVKKPAEGWDKEYGQAVEKESESIWAEAEAWVEAEAEAEEQAWLAMGVETATVKPPKVLTLEKRDPTSAFSPSSKSPKAKKGKGKATTTTTTTTTTVVSPRSKGESIPSETNTSFNMADKRDTTDRLEPQAGVPKSEGRLAGTMATAKASWADMMDEDSTPTSTPPTSPLRTAEPEIAAERAHALKDPVASVKTAVEPLSVETETPAATPPSADTKDAKDGPFSFSAIGTASTPASRPPRPPSSGSRSDVTVTSTPYRSLHDKLSSPERSKRRQSPQEVKLLSEARQKAAESKRVEILNEKQQVAARSTERAQAISYKNAVKQARSEANISEKLRDAERRQKEYIRSIQEKAENENAKVREVRSVQNLNAEELTQQLQHRLEEAEARVKAGYLRHQEHLLNISGTNKRRNKKRSQQMSSLQIEIETQREQRWHKLQTRIEAVNFRRDARMAEIQRRSKEKEGTGTPSSTPGGHSIMSPDPASEDVDRRFYEGPTTPVADKSGGDNGDCPSRLDSLTVSPSSGDDADYDGQGAHERTGGKSLSLMLQRPAGHTPADEDRAAVSMPSTSAVPMRWAARQPSSSRTADTPQSPARQAPSSSSSKSTIHSSSSVNASPGKSRTKGKYCNVAEDAQPAKSPRVEGDGWTVAGKGVTRTGQKPFPTAFPVLAGKSHGKFNDVPVPTEPVEVTMVTPAPVPEPTSATSSHETTPSRTSKSKATKKKKAAAGRLRAESSLSVEFVDDWQLDVEVSSTSGVSSGSSTSLAAVLEVLSDAASKKDALSARATMLNSVYFQSEKDAAFFSPLTTMVATTSPMYGALVACLTSARALVVAPAGATLSQWCHLTSAAEEGGSGSGSGSASTPSIAVTRITKACVTALLQLFLTVEPGSLATSTRAFYDDLVAEGVMQEMEELAKKRKRKKKKGSAAALEGGAAKAAFTPAMAAGAVKSALISAGPACDLAVRSFLAQAARKADTDVDGPTALVATLLLDPSTGNAMRAVDSDAIEATMMLPTLATLVECTAEENTLQVALMDMWLYQLVYFQKVPTREGANALATIAPAVIKTLEGKHGHVMCRYALSCGAVSRIAAMVDALTGRLKKDNWVISLLDHLTRCLAPVVNSAGYPLFTLTEKVAPEKLSTEPWAVTVAGSVSKAICVLAPLVQRKTVTDLPLRVTGSLFKSFTGLMARASPATLDAHLHSGLCVATADLVDLLLSTMGDDKSGTSLSAVTAEGNLAMILTGVCWLARTSASLRTGFGGIVKDLSTVPPAFMTDRRRHVVIPALLALCLDDANNVTIVRDEMSTTHFTEYLSRMESVLHSYEEEKKKNSNNEEEGEDKNTENAKEFAALHMVANRFPVFLWNAAWEFF